MPLARTNRGTKSLTVASQSTNTLVSDSFSPAAGSLILVLFHEFTSDASHSLTMSTTLSGMGSWTYGSVANADGFGSYFVSRFAWAVCGATPGTGTVTCTRRAGVFTAGMMAEFFEISGQTATPIRQTVTNQASSATSMSLNFASAVLASSYVFLSCLDDGNGSAPGLPSGFTGLGSVQLRTNDAWARNAEDLASANQNNSWSGLGNFKTTGVGVEVAENTGTDAAAEVASVTASSVAATVSLAPTAGVASTAAAAAGGSASIGPSAGAATAAVSGLGPSVTTLSATVTANAGVGAVTAAAGDPSVAVAAKAGAASVGVAAPTAAGSASVAAAAEGASVGVAAGSPGIQTDEPPTVFVYMPSDVELLDLTVSQRAEGFEFLVLDSQNRKIGQVYPNYGAAITNNADQAIKRRMTLTIPPDQYNDLNVLRDRIMPRMVLENGSRYALGVFLFADASSPKFSYGQSMDATLVDQGLILGQPLRGALGWNTGDLVTDAMKKVYEVFGISTAYIDYSSATFGNPFGFLGGGNETAASILDQLAKLAGFYSPYFDNDGIPRARAAIDPASTTPSLVYNAGGRIIAGSIIVANDLLSAPNTYIVVDTSATDAPIGAEYPLPDDAPHSIANRGFAIPKTTNAPAIGTHEAAYALAKQLAQTEVKAYETVHFQSSTDPRHDTFDPVTFLGEKYIETAWSIACVPGGPMGHELKRVYV